MPSRSYAYYSAIQQFDKSIIQKEWSCLSCPPSPLFFTKIAKDPIDEKTCADAKNVSRPYNVDLRYAPSSSVLLYKPQAFLHATTTLQQCNKSIIKKSQIPLHVSLLPSSSFYQNRTSELMRRRTPTPRNSRRPLDVDLRCLPSSFLQNLKLPCMPQNTARLQRDCLNTIHELELCPLILFPSLLQNDENPVHEKKCGHSEVQPNTNISLVVTSPLTHYKLHKHIPTAKKRQISKTVCNNIYISPLLRVTKFTNNKRIRRTVLNQKSS
jgi:hypothetical protein